MNSQNHFLERCKILLVFLLLIFFDIVGFLQGFLNAFCDALEFLCSILLDVFVNLEEDYLEARLLLNKIKDLEIFFIELSFLLVDEQFKTLHNLFVSMDDSSSGIHSKDYADYLL